MNKELEEPQMPLRPIPYSEWMDKDAYGEMERRYESLLSEYRRLLSIKNDQIEGISPSIDEDKEVYTVEEYEMLLRKYATARDKYNGKYDGMIETKEMVQIPIDEKSEHVDGYAKFITENQYRSELKSFLAQIEDSTNIPAWDFDKDKKLLNIIDQIEA